MPTTECVRSLITEHMASGVKLAVWWQLNLRLLKWVKWEKGLYKKAGLQYLRTKYRELTQFICTLVIGMSVKLNIFSDLTTT